MACVNFDEQSNVKKEETNDSTGLADATECSQPSGDSWKTVRLISVSLPQAVVELVGEVDKAVVRQTFSLCVDELRAVTKVKEVKAIIHPSLQEPVQTLDKYDYDLCESVFTRAVAEHILLWAHISVQTGVEQLSISRLSADGKLPLTLQVRALEPFKKGALVLAPALGELLQADAEADSRLARSQGVVHEALLSHVKLNVYAGQMDRRRKSDTKAVKTTPFVIHSPLLAGKSQKNRSACVENLAPFWAVLRCAGTSSWHNMELDSATLSDPGFELKGGSFPKIPQTAGFRVELPILRNVSPISKGDVLCLPFLLPFLDE
jgi:hypothetical protein